MCLVAAAQHRQYQEMARNLFLTHGHQWMRLLQYLKNCLLLQHWMKSMMMNTWVLCGEIIFKNLQQQILFSRYNKNIENIPSSKGALSHNMSSDQSFDLQSSNSLCVKTSTVGILANEVGKKEKTKWYHCGLTCHRPKTYAVNLLKKKKKKDAKDNINV